MNNTEFIEKIAGYVRKNAPLYGILVYSPIIAQAVLESASGTSELAKVHNYFGLKYRKDRCPTASGYYIKVGSEQNADGSYFSSEMKWFRFANMEMGVLGYLDFIDAPNYAALKGETNPKTYLEKIKAAGYATSLKYVENLMNVIEKYNLTKYDNAEVKTMAKVFLSAGHGGSDPGATAYGLKEKNINLQTLLACKDVLEEHGVDVICSRTKDENDPVAQEVKEANASGAKIAVSFHVNAGGGDGFEAFYYSGSKDGLNLAKLGEKYVKEIGQNSRGVKTGNHLYFVKKTTMPAVLFESFFVDNDKDNDIGDTTAEQSAFGVAYAKAILEHLKITYNEKQESKPEPETNTSSGLYRVQCGAYKNESNAEALKKQLQAAGYPAIVVKY